MATGATTGGVLRPSGLASSWSPARRKIGTNACGEWLRFLADRGDLDPHCTPGARVTEERLRRFLGRLEARVAPVSVDMVIGATKRMLDVLDPDGKSELLGTLYANLKRTARPSRNKLSRMVPARQLFELGLHLVGTCGEGMRSSGEDRNDPYVATRFRDRLIIAMLAGCPIRLKNLATIEIGKHLTFDGERHHLSFEAHETRTGRPYFADLPGELDPWIECYLTMHRPRLMAEASATETGAGEETALWINRWRRPFSDRGVRMQIKLRTESAFGTAVSPHLFRDCAVTELVDLAPDQIGIAPDLLGHGRLETTQKHYIQATGMKAHRAIHEALSTVRDAARKRRRRSFPG